MKQERSLKSGVKIKNNLNYNSTFLVCGNKKAKTNKRTFLANSPSAYYWCLEDSCSIIRMKSVWWAVQRYMKVARTWQSTRDKLVETQHSHGPKNYVYSCAPSFHQSISQLHQHSCCDTGGSVNASASKKRRVVVVWGVGGVEGGETAGFHVKSPCCCCPEPSGLLPCHRSLSDSRPDF